MKISVIIPHLNQENQLETCLESLHLQEDIDNLEVEFIVVDNGSQQLPTAVCEQWSDVTLVTESTPGPGPARNRGIAEAHGDLLAFIDADCSAAPAWIATVARTLRLPETPIIGGDVRVGYVNPRTPTSLEAYENIYAYRNDSYITRQGFSGTGNLATFPEVMAEVGPFAGINVSEDRDWGQRATAKGYKITYVPEMIIYHPARESFAALRRKWDRHIAHDYERIYPKPFGSLRWLVRAMAIVASPLYEIWKILTSPRINGLRTRWLAMMCLTRIRIYRASQMVRVLLRGGGRTLSGAWNR